MRAGFIAAAPLQRNAAVNNLNSSMSQRAWCMPRAIRPLVAVSPKLSPQLSRPDRRAKLVIANVAEFTRTTPAEAILCAKFAAHSASVASVTVIEDSGEYLFSCYRRLCLPAVWASRFLPFNYLLLNLPLISF